MLAGLFLLCMSMAPRTALSAQGEGPVAIRAKTVIVRPGQVLQDGIVLIDRGVVVGVGSDVAIPEGARVLEGDVACAGFVDAWSSLSVDPGSAADGTVGPAARTADAVDPWELPELRAEALRSGVTAARVQAGRQAIFAGFGTLLRTDGQLDSAIVLPDACQASAIGAGGRGDVFDRLDEIDRLVQALDKGRRYRESLLEYRDELAGWEKTIAEKAEELEKDFKKAKKAREKDEKDAEEKGKEFKPKKYREDRKPRPVKRDEDDAAMARAVDGEVPLVVEVHRANEIRRLLEKTAQFDRLRLVLAGATEALSCADDLAERDVPVILWPTPMGATRPDEWREHDLALAGELARKGVRVLFGSGGTATARELRYLAALAVGHGMEREAALQAITSEPARVFDSGGRLGSLEPGRSADVLVFDGDPLDTTARLLFVVSRGTVVQ